MSNLLNNTICNGPVLSSVISKGPPMRAVVGYKISKTNFDLTGIPVTCSKRAPRLHLGLSFRLAPDEAQMYLMVTSSVMVLATGKDVSNDANILLHYDYDREKEDGYPEAHLHACATSDTWTSVRRLDSEGPALEKLHLPVGPRRFRPTLEDVVDFLVTERLVEKHPNCDAALRASRVDFHTKQLRAAVRRNPQPAVDELQDLGYKVTSPSP